MVYYIYKDRAGFWRWQLVASNGKVISDSGEGYYNRADCIHGINLNASSNGAPIRDR